MKNFFLVMLFFQQGYFFCSDKLSILDANNSKKLSELSLSQKLISAAKDGNEDEFRNIMKDKNFHKISQQDLGSCLTCAAQNGRTNIIDLIATDTKFDTISQDKLGYYLGPVLLGSVTKLQRQNQEPIILSIMKSKGFSKIYRFELDKFLILAFSRHYLNIIKFFLIEENLCKIGDSALGEILGMASLSAFNQDLFKLIIKSKELERIPLEFLEKSFLNSLQSFDDEIISLTINSKRFYEVSDKIFDTMPTTVLLNILEKTNSKDVISLIIKNKNFAEIEFVKHLQCSLSNAIKDGQKDKVELIISHKAFDQLNPSQLKELLLKALEKGQEDIVKLLINHKTFEIISARSLESLLSIATKKDQKNIVDLLSEYKKHNQKVN